MKRPGKSKTVKALQRQIMTFGLFISIAISNPAWCAENEFQNAVRTSNLENISRLIDFTEDVDLRGTNGKTALMIAAKAGDAGLAKKLLQAGADSRAVNINGGTPVMFAAINGDVETIILLIDSGADVNLRGRNGWSALMIAAAKGHVGATRRIVDAGADINTTDIYLWTPLHRAAYENRVEVVKLLLESQVIDIQHRDEHGATALHHAALNGNTEIVNMLMLKGIDPGNTDFSGRTPAMYAKDSGHQKLARLLEKAQ